MTDWNAVPYMWSLITECFFFLFFASLLFLVRLWVRDCSCGRTHTERGCWRSITQNKDFSLLPGGNTAICSSNLVHIFNLSEKKIWIINQPLLKMFTVLFNNCVKYFNNTTVMYGENFKILKISSATKYIGVWF